MPSTTFSTATDAATVTFDFDQSGNWQVTLGGNRTLVFAGGQEGDTINVMLIQDSTGGRTATWPTNVTWQSGQGPALKTAAGAIDVFTFVKRGSAWQDAAGATSRLPSRIAAAGLGTILGVGATVLTLSLSGGNGANGNNPDALNVRTKTGAELHTRIDGTGSVLVGSGIIAVKTVDARGANAKFLVQNNGATVIRSTVSGAQMTVNATSAGSGKLKVHGSDGGYICIQDVNGGGWTECNTSAGTMRCFAAAASDCAF